MHDNTIFNEYDANKLQRNEKNVQKNIRKLSRSGLKVGRGMISCKFSYEKFQIHRLGRAEESATELKQPELELLQLHKHS